MPPTLASRIAGRWEAGMPTSYIAAAWIDRVAALHALADRLRVAEVAGDQLAAQVGDRRPLLGRAHQAGHLVAARAELAHDLAADETCASRDENLHRS